MERIYPQLRPLGDSSASTCRAQRSSRRLAEVSPRRPPARTLPATATTWARRQAESRLSIRSLIEHSRWSNHTLQVERCLPWAGIRSPVLGGSGSGRCTRLAGNSVGTATGSPAGPAALTALQRCTRVARSDVIFEPPPPTPLLPRACSRAAPTTSFSEKWFTTARGAPSCIALCFGSGGCLREHCTLRSHRTRWAANHYQSPWPGHSRAMAGPKHSCPPPPGPRRGCQVLYC